MILDKVREQDQEKTENTSCPPNLMIMFQEYDASFSTPVGNGMKLNQYENEF